MSTPAGLSGTNLPFAVALKGQRRKLGRSGWLALLVLHLALPLTAASGSAAGSICIAPFHLDDSNPMGGTGLGPTMSNTPAPLATSVFTFVVDKHLKATVRNHQMSLITNVPTDRKVKVAVRMDGKGFETFSLDLGKIPEHRACLWLYPGYWHWIEGWDAKRGCKCEETTPPGS